MGSLFLQGDEPSQDHVDKIWFSYNSYYLGPMAGTATPNLNAAKLFMRGSSDESAGTVEDDSVQDHQHADPGHTHSVWCRTDIDEALIRTLIKIASKVNSGWFQFYNEN